MKSLHIMYLILLFPFLVHAETKETENLDNLSTDYARCAAFVVGNFDTRKKQLEVTSLFYSAIINNIQVSTDIEIKAGNKSIIDMLDLVGDKDIYTGILLQIILEHNRQKGINSNWKQQNIDLWKKHGCNAVYKGLIG